MALADWRTGRRTERAVAAMGGLMLLWIFCPPAGAVTARLAGGTLNIIDTTGTANVLDVLPRGFGGFEVFDAAGGVVAGDGCKSVSSQEVFCTGVAIFADVDAGAADDLVGLWDLEIPARVRGGPGDDGIAGGVGSDQLTGDAGIDSITGKEGVDRLAGGTGDDVLDGGPQTDLLLGEEDDDIAAGGDGADVVIGGTGRDLLRGGRGDDLIDGGEGDDALIGNGGVNTIETGPGEDDVFGQRNPDDRIDCRAGDRIRVGAGHAPNACGELPSAVQVPDTWPPDADRSSASTAQVPLNVSGEPQRPGAARHAWYGVSDGFGGHSVIDVRVRLLRGHHRLYRHCFRDVLTNAVHSFTVPRRARRATKLKGKAHIGVHCRRG